MSDLSQRIAALSQAKRDLLLLELKKRAEMVQRAVPSLGKGVAAKAMTVEELKAEALLDPAIQPAPAPAGYAERRDSVFLTGASGYVGAYLLDELLKQTGATIYCLVRGAGPDEGRARIQRNLESYGLRDEPLDTRVIPVIGDLSQPLFGLATQQFGALAGQIDVVYHCGAIVKWTYPYSALKAANVLGTQEVLRLACHTGAKPVHFISTVGVFSSPQYHSEMVPEEEDLEQSGPLYVGYAQSKWVAEKLVTIARSRGLPVSIYRPAIGGHSQTGLFNVHDHVCLMIKGCIQMGYAPDIDVMLQIAPIDYVSRAIIYLSRQKESAGRAFHMVNPETIPWSTLFGWIRDYGYPLQQVTYDKWKAKLMQQVLSFQQNALYALSPIFSDALAENARLPYFDCRNTLDGLAGTPIVCPPLDPELFNVYLSYFIRSGFLHAP